MRVNLIVNGSPGLMQDCALLVGIVSHVLGEDNVQFRKVPHVHPQCEEAEVNVFFEILNPSLFPYARRNIWIPNAEWTYRNWKPYAKHLDEIWVKTHEAAELFKDWGTVKYVGWTSIDKVPSEIRNYHKAMVPIGKNPWRHPRPILQAYHRIHEEHESLFDQLPELHLVYNSKLLGDYSIPPTIARKVKVHKEVLSPEEYDALLHECGLVILTSVAEGFCHAVNEAMSAGSNLILPDMPVFRELTTHAMFAEVSKTVPHPDCLGVLAEVSVDSLIVQLRKYTQLSFKARKDASQFVRDDYEARHTAWMERFQAAGLPLESDYSLKALLPPEETLPKVSILTVTRNRRHFFGLAKFSFLSQAYPADKLEWVIVDDGIDQIKDLVTDLPYVRYILLDTPHTIGQKRNIAAEAASGEVLVHMDDDDVYPNHSVLTRVAMLKMAPEKPCVFSTTIPCYDIQKRISFMNVPPFTLPWSERVSEATMAYTKAFWEAGKFPDQQIAEGDGFIRGREEACRELSPQDVIVSLTHSKMTSSRKVPEMKEPNGCHYGFSDELFTLIEEIAQGL